MPTERGTAFLTGLAGRGVRVQVLTNGLASTDVPVVHAGYVRRRPALLAGGVQLFEFKRSSSLPPTHDQASASGSSDASLHAKTFSIDGRQVFVGSFNFDPRSARLNTELGFLIDSPALAQGMAQSLQAELAQRVYQVRLAADGSLRWVESSGDGERAHEQEPGTGIGLRSLVRVLSWLPIEWLL
ncbi:phospholipase D-like domain-containing protein [Ramlibacter tataouinensis]|uniref:phospholipase D-like domain-containing protein n=1 Tax=Ramlibacter tataouinensis TaxID=94132 RepID=UPI00300DC169